MFLSFGSRNAVELKLCILLKVMLTIPMVCGLPQTSGVIPEESANTSDVAWRYSISNLSSDATAGNTTFNLTVPDWITLDWSADAYRFKGEYNREINIDNLTSFTGLAVVGIQLNNLLAFLDPKATVAPGSRIVTYLIQSKAEMVWLDQGPAWTAAKSSHALGVFLDTSRQEVPYSLHPLYVTISSNALPETPRVEFGIRLISDLELITLRFGENYDLRTSFAGEDVILKRDAERAINKGLQKLQESPSITPHVTETFCTRTVCLVYDVYDAPPGEERFPSEIMTGAVGAIQQHVLGHRGGVWTGMTANLKQDDGQLGSIALLPVTFINPASSYLSLNSSLIPESRANLL